MTEARVGRLLAASLHQAIADELPLRLEFYEHWLRSEGLRDGSIGLGPITAVVGFLRTEGDGYDRVMARAGQLAAEWTVASMPAARRRWIGWLPRPLRARAALGVAAGIVRSICSSSRASVRVRRRSARLVVTASLFCTARARPSSPLCGFYAALAAGTLSRFGVPAAAELERCHALGGGACVVALDLVRAGAAAGPARAA
jgi:predicted hydrocarbon binding protein